MERNNNDLKINIFFYLPKYDEKHISIVYCPIFLFLDITTFIANGGNLLGFFIILVNTNNSVQDKTSSSSIASKKTGIGVAWVR